MEEDAVVGVFCRRWGVPLIDGGACACRQTYKTAVFYVVSFWFTLRCSGTVRLPRLIGLSRAMDLILTGRGMTSQEALESGFANRVVPKGWLDSGHI